MVNLPETGRARWGDILDAEKMKQYKWVRPKLVAVIEFLEWTEADRLRNSKFVALRELPLRRSLKTPSFTPVLRLPTDCRTGKLRAPIDS
jgi:ATP-dependent DNA ligase